MKIETRSAANSFLGKVGLLAAVLLACIAPLFAQSYRGSIRGEVRDQSGAVVAGAAVRARNLATGEERSITTGPDGAYVLPELGAGDYEVTAEAQGFQPSKLKVAVLVGAETVADIVVGVGKVEQTVSVEEMVLYATVSSPECSASAIWRRM